jgi:hypothetical protein
MVALPVACIVEGHGEERAVPILLRRLVRFVNPQVYADVRPPIRKPRGTRLSGGGLEGAVELAVRGLPPSGVVLVIVDSDDDCHKKQAPLLLERAIRTAAGRRPVAVVLAKREFEAWFIDASESIAGYAGLKIGLAAPPNPESIRDAKGWLRENMPSGRKYSETVDQPALAKIFDLTAARQAPSFDKLCREIERFCAIASLSDY